MAVTSRELKPYFYSNSLMFLYFGSVSRCSLFSCWENVVNSCRGPHSSSSTTAQCSRSDTHTHTYIWIFFFFNFSQSAHAFSPLLWSLRYSPLSTQQTGHIEPSSRSGLSSHWGYLKVKGHYTARVKQEMALIFIFSWFRFVLWIGLMFVRENIWPGSRVNTTRLFRITRGPTSTLTLTSVVSSWPKPLTTNNHIFLY